MPSLALLVAVALLLAACGGSSQSSATATAPPPAHTTTAVAPRTTTTVTITRTVPSARGAGRGRCVASELELSFLGQQGAAGHGLLGFALRNTNGRSCRTSGYPGILFLGRSGQPLTTIPTHTTHDFFGPAPLARLTVVPGATVSFRLGVTHGAVPGSVCTTAYGLQVIPPDDTATLRTSIPGGAYECRTATVSPLQRGATAYP